LIGIFRCYTAKIVFFGQASPVAQANAPEGHDQIK
jgi:hypothetical protein